MKNKLEIAREIINSCDEEIIVLFKKRMEAATLVAEYKKENDLPILDQKREDLLIEKNINKLNDPILENYYLEVLKTILKVSKDYQKELIK